MDTMPWGEEEQVFMKEEQVFMKECKWKSKKKRRKQSVEETSESDGSLSASSDSDSGFESASGQRKKEQCHRRRVRLPKITNKKLAQRRTAVSKAKTQQLGYDDIVVHLVDPGSGHHSW
jgi:hypothetical protein